MSAGIPCEQEFKDLLSSRGVSEEAISDALSHASEYIAFLESNGVSIDGSSVDYVKNYVKGLMRARPGLSWLERVYKES